MQNLVEKIIYLNPMFKEQGQVTMFVWVTVGEAMYFDFGNLGPLLQERLEKSI